MDARKSEFAQGGRHLAGAFAGVAGGFTSLYAYSAGIFIAPLVAEYGWTRTQASLSTMAIPIVTVVAAPLAGRLVDRYGVIRIAIPSIVGLGVGFMALGAFTAGLASFIALVILAALLSSASTPLSFNRVIVAAFRRHRGLALGIALTGSGIGAVLAPPIVTDVIAEHGWRAGYYVLGLWALLSAVACWWLLRDERRPSPEGIISTKQQGSIFRNRAFISLACVIFLASSAVLGTMFHFVPMLIGRGMNSASAGALASLFGLAVIGGRIATGFLLDIGNAAVIIALLLLLSACGMTILTAGDLPVFAGAILVGFGLGTEGDLIAYLLSRRFPLAQYSTAYGGIFAVHSVGGGVGPIVAGVLYDRSGGYATWFFLAAAAMFLAAIIVLATEYRTPPPPEA